METTLDVLAIKKHHVISPQRLKQECARLSVIEVHPSCWIDGVQISAAL